MKLIFVRHGLAEKKHPQQNENDDFDRELTRGGVVEVKEMLHSCYFLFKNMECIFTSPLVRAVETAQLIYQAFTPNCFELMPSLDTLSPVQHFKQDLETLDSDKTYCFVGHEPHLTDSINLLLNNEANGKIKLAKGGIVILEGEGLSELKISLILSPKDVLKF